MKTYEHLTLYLESDRLIILNMRKDIQQKLKGMPELLSISQVAEIFSIHPDTLRNWEKDNRIPTYKAPFNKRRLYKKEDLQAYLDNIAKELNGK